MRTSAYSDRRHTSFNPLSAIFNLLFRVVGWTIHIALTLLLLAVALSVALHVAQDYPVMDFSSLEALNKSAPDTLDRMILGTIILVFYCLYLWGRRRVVDAFAREGFLGVLACILKFFLYAVLAIVTGGIYFIIRVFVAMGDSSLEEGKSEMQELLERQNEYEAWRSHSRWIYDEDPI